jgi:hypothetical protein
MKIEACILKHAEMYPNVRGESDGEPDQPVQGRAGWRDRWLELSGVHFSDSFRWDAECG